jgi:Protein of unknown function (DUF3089)
MALQFFKIGNYFIVLIKVRMQRLRFALLILLFPALFCCSPRYSDPLQSSPAERTNTADYSNLDNWAAHPWKDDPSDKVPAPLAARHSFDSTVDVFFIHPTTYTVANPATWNAELNDTALNQKTDLSTIQYQASAFNHYRVFAPRYRQAHLRAYYSPDTVSARRALNEAYADVASAFQYYLDHYNQGRPVIIASHSQGTTHGIRLLQEYFVGKPLQTQLVAAYLIGMYVPADLLLSIGACKDSLATVCVCSWRTFRSGFQPEYVNKEKAPALITNPLNWRTDSTYADRRLNKGAVLRNFNKVETDVVDAQIHDHVLWVGRLHVPGGLLYRNKNLHIGDINLFYLNIVENVAARVKAYNGQR